MIIVSCDEKMKFHFFIVRDASPSLILSITLKMIILQRRREFWMEVLRLRILSRTNREDVFWNGDFRVHTLFMILLPYVFRKIYHSSDPPRPPPPPPPPPILFGEGHRILKKNLKLHNPSIKSIFRITSIIYFWSITNTH